MEPLISIIVPVYNTEKYLDRCIQSIVNQTYKNLEIILVDDGSTDKSAEICDNYASIDDRIRVIHKKNGGSSSARNAGLDACNGEYIGFIDSDDYISLDMYENLYMMCNNVVSISTIGMKEVSAYDTSTDSGNTDITFNTNEYYLKKILLKDDGGSVCSRLFHKDIISDIRFKENKLNEDVLFMVDVLSRIRSVIYINEIGYYYFSREGSNSRQFGKAVHDMVGNSTEIKHYVEEKFPSLIKEAEYFEIFQHMSFLLCCPYNYNRAEDPMCAEVLSFIRKNLLKGLKNPHFSNKNKLKLISVALFPTMTSYLVEKKAKKSD